MKLYLYLKTRETSITLHLEGASIAAPVKGTFYAPGRGKVTHTEGEERITEEMKIRCAGTRDQILALVDTINEMLSYNAHRLNDFDELQLRVEYEAANTWASQILGGFLETASTGIAARELGTDVITFTFTRLNYWEDVIGEQLELSNGSGMRQSEVTIYNHSDAGTAHHNYFDILGTDVGGDLPAPLSLRLGHLNAGREISQVWVAQANSLAVLPSSWLPVYEVENGAAGSGFTLTSQADAASSAGYFARLAGAAGAEAELVSLALTQAQVSWYGGRYYKPVIRLANNHAYTDLWLKARITYGASRATAYDSGWVRCVDAQPVVELNAVKIAPYPSTAAYADALYLSLYVMKTSPASITLDLDFVQVSPTDGFNRLDMLQALAAGYHIQEGEKVGSYAWNNVTLAAIPSHVRVGSALTVTPAMNSRIFVLHWSGTAMPVDTTLAVGISFNKRKRNI